MPGLSAVVSLGQSIQEFELTGIGPNAAGQGQSRISRGTCFFDGTTTACTLSGTFTGTGKGGTYSLNVSYPGEWNIPPERDHRARQQLNIGPSDGKLLLRHYTGGDGRSHHFLLQLRQPIHSIYKPDLHRSPCLRSWPGRADAKCNDHRTGYGLVQYGAGGRGVRRGERHQLWRVSLDCTRNVDRDLRCKSRH